VLTPNRKPFVATALAGSEILVIANAAGDDLESGTDSSVALPAFTRDEVEAVYHWVHDGGRLLLIADHAPFGAAAGTLAARFGVHMSGGYTIDSSEAVPGEGNPGILEFARDRGSLGDHVILRGRDPSERVTRVIAFTGQSLLGPGGSAPLLNLCPASRDIPFSTFAQRQDFDALLRQATPAGGRSMGVALQIGRGRVVALGEAAMLSARVVSRPGAEPRKIGMNRPGTDNQQLALNVIRWLAGALN